MKTTESEAGKAVAEATEDQKALAQENDRVEAESAEDAAPQVSWDKAVIVARGKIPANPAGAVIVVQTSDREAEKAPSHRDTTLAALKSATYPKGADLYFGIGDEADFGDRSPVCRVGVRGRGNVTAFGYNRFSLRPGTVNVGPASPVYAAVNYAYNKGARSIEIVGLKPEEIETLKPWLDAAADSVKDLDLSYGG